MEAVEALTPEVGTASACAAIGISRASVYRHRVKRNGLPPESQKRPSPPRALSPQERQEVLDVLHSERFVDQAPQEVYAALLDKGQYPPLLYPDHVSPPRWPRRSKRAPGPDAPSCLPEA